MQHSISQSTPGKAKSGGNAGQHQAINTRPTKTGQKRTTSQDNRYQGEQDGAATQHCTREGLATSGSNAGQH
jgi:hypothetical protein